MIVKIYFRWHLWCILDGNMDFEDNLAINRHFHEGV